MECGPDIDVRGDRNLALMLLGNHEVRERKSLARIVRHIWSVFPDKRFEEVHLFFMSQTDAIVLDTDPETVIAHVHPDQDGRFACRILDPAECIAGMSEQTEQ